MDRIDLFRIFARVVESASFTHAAATLDLPRSTVSTAIQDLEARLGTRLLARTTRRVAPTPDGATFYEQCVRLVADIEEAESQFRRDPAGPRGALRVDMPGRIGRLVVAPALPDFLARYPDITIELGVTDRAVNLIEDGTDCALRVGPIHDSALIARRMGEFRLLNLASPAYLARHGMPRHPDDLPAHQAVRYASPASGRVEPWEWLQDGTLRTLTLPGRVTVNSAEALIACCLAGLGMIQVPAFDVQDHLRSGALVDLLPDWRAEPMPLTLLHPHRRHAARRVRVFADWLSGLMAPLLRS